MLYSVLLAEEELGQMDWYVYLIYGINIGSFLFYVIKHLMNHVQLFEPSVVFG
jgi:hypothetical protein